MRIVDELVDILLDIVEFVSSLFLGVFLGFGVLIELIKIKLTKKK